MKIIFNFLPALLCFLLVACSGDSGESNSTDNSTIVKTIKVGYLPIADCAQLYVAIEKGFFKEHGINVERIELASGVKILEALVTDSIDIGFSAVAPLILANARNLDLKALTGGPAENEQHREHAILVDQNSTIKTAKDLEGKTIGIVAFRSIDEPFVKEWLAIHNVDVNSVGFYEIRFPQMETTLLSGQVDAVAAIEPFVTKARLNGRTRVLGYNYTDVQPFTQVASYNARSKWIDKNNDSAKRFKHALADAAVYANDHPQEVKKIIAEYTKLPLALANEITLPFFTETLKSEDLTNVMNLMLKWEIIESPVNTESIIY
jgi:NitT/TauT family transport system substrate-binding protein